MPVQETPSSISRSKSKNSENSAGEPRLAYTDSIRSNNSSNGSSRTNTIRHVQHEHRKVSVNNDLKQTLKEEPIDVGQLDTDRPPIETIEILDSSDEDTVLQHHGDDYEDDDEDEDEDEDEEDDDDFEVEVTEAIKPPKRVSWTQGVLNRIPLLNRANSVPTNHNKDEIDQILEPIRTLRNTPSKEVNRISYEVERILTNAKQQLTEMDDYLSRHSTTSGSGSGAGAGQARPQQQQQQEQPQTSPMRDSGIQHSDEDDRYIMTTESPSMDNSTTIRRTSIAPSLVNRSSLYSQYSPVLEKATQVEFATTNTINESDHSNSNSSSIQNKSSSEMSNFSAQRKVSLKKVRDTTNEMSKLLDELKTLRSTTNDYQNRHIQTQQQLLQLQNSNGKDTSPEDFSSSSFETNHYQVAHRQATPPLLKDEEKTQGQVTDNTKVQKPPTPPATTGTESQAIEGITAWTSNAKQSQTESQPDAHPQQDESADKVADLEDRDSKPVTRSVSYPPNHAQASRRNSTQTSIVSSEEENLDGLISSLDSYRSRLNILNQDADQLQQQQQQPLNQQTEEEFPSSPFGKQIGVPPPSRPPPPIPPTLPPLSYSWQQQPSLKDEMDSLLDVPNAPFKLQKQMSHDSSTAESFMTAQSPSDVAEYESDEHEQEQEANKDEGVLLPPMDDKKQSTTQYHPEQEHEKEEEQDNDKALESDTSPLNYRKSYLSESRSSPVLVVPRRDSRRAISTSSVSSNRPLPQIPTEEKRHSSISAYHLQQQQPPPTSSFKLSESTGSISTITASNNRRKSGVSHEPREDTELYHSTIPEEQRRRSKQHRHEHRRESMPEDDPAAVRAADRPKKHRHRHHRDSHHHHHHEKYHKREKSQSREKKRHSSASAVPAEQPKFSQPNVERLMNMADDSVKLEELDLPPDERHLLEKFIDALSKLSVEMNLDERKKVEGKRRLQNALRAIEGWI